MRLFATNRQTKVPEVHFLGHYPSVAAARRRILRSATPKQRVGPGFDPLLYRLRLEGAPGRHVRPLADGSEWARDFIRALAAGPITETEYRQLYWDADEEVESTDPVA